MAFGSQSLTYLHIREKGVEAEGGKPFRTSKSTEPPVPLVGGLEDLPHQHVSKVKAPPEGQGCGGWWGGTVGSWVGIKLP